jgi:hypothetical protein
MDIGQHETEIVIVGIVALTISIVTHSISETIYGSLMGALLGYSFHAIASSQVA